MVWGAGGEATLAEAERVALRTELGIDESDLWPSARVDVAVRRRW
jgi:hypothetical protein